MPRLGTGGPGSPRPPPERSAGRARGDPPVSLCLPVSPCLGSRHFISARGALAPGSHDRAALLARRGRGGGGGGRPHGLVIAGPAPGGSQDRGQVGRGPTQASRHRETPAPAPGGVGTGRRVRPGGWATAGLKAAPSRAAAPASAPLPRRDGLVAPPAVLAAAAAAAEGPRGGAGVPAGNTPRGGGRLQGRDGDAAGGPAGTGVQAAGGAGPAAPPLSPDFAGKDRGSGWRGWTLPRSGPKTPGTVAPLRVVSLPHLASDTLSCPPAHPRLPRPRVH